MKVNIKIRYNREKKLKGRENMSEVKHLEINYKTDELFEDFREFGNKDLYMVEELKGQIHTEMMKAILKFEIRVK